jgi:hypothetical protein
MNKFKCFRTLVEEVLMESTKVKGANVLLCKGNHLD